MRGRPFDRRTVLWTMAFGFVSVVAVIVLAAALVFPGALALLFPSFFLWILLFVWVVRRLHRGSWEPRGREGT